MGKQDEKISLLQRLIEHATNTARYNIYYGEGRDTYDERGRAAHEAVFNVASRTFRCPNSQQGYAPFTTWTRGQAWAICGCAEQLEFLRGCVRENAAKRNGRALTNAAKVFETAARATADHYLANSCADGIPMWDTAAPICIAWVTGRTKPPTPTTRGAGGQFGSGDRRTGFVATRSFSDATRNTQHAARYRQAALTIADTLFSEPYLATSASIKA